MEINKNTANTTKNSITMKKCAMNKEFRNEEKKSINNSESNLILDN